MEERDPFHGRYSSMRNYEDMIHPLERDFGSQERLPFDPRTLLIGILRRKLIFLFFFTTSLFLGVTLGKTFGGVNYQAESILLFRPVNKDSTNLATEMHMVKTRTNLEEVKDKLGLEISPSALGAACDVDIQRGTDMLVIRTVWTTAKEAADIANTLREVYLANHRKIQKKDAKAQMEGLTKQLEDVNQQLKGARLDIDKFTEKNRIVDLESTVKWHYEQLSQANRQYEQAVMDKKTLALQKEKLKSVISDGEDKSPKKKKKSKVSKAVENDASGETVQEAPVPKSRPKRTHMTEQELELEETRKLYKAGAISKYEYQKKRAALEMQQGLRTDEYKSKAFDIDMELTASEEKVQYLQKNRDDLQVKLETLGNLEREYQELSRSSNLLEKQRTQIEEDLAKVRQLYRSKESDFSVVAKAKIPTQPHDSGRKLLTAAITAFGTFLGVLLIILLELMDTTIRSGKELSLKLSLPVLYALPHVTGNNLIFPGQTESVLIEPFRMIAKRVREAAPKKGARILIVSTKHDEGKTLVAANLAACFGRKDDRVLLIDAQIRSKTKRWSLRHLTSKKNEAMKGLGEYLSFQADQLSEIVSATSLPGVDCIPAVGEAVIPDLLGSNRMYDLLKEASRQYGIVLIDSSPLLSYVDAELLAQWADGIVFVVRSRMCKVSTLEKAVARLKLSRVPVVGAVLNCVDSLYLEKD